MGAGDTYSDTRVTDSDGETEERKVGHTRELAEAYFATVARIHRQEYCLCTAMQRLPHTVTQARSA